MAKLVYVDKDATGSGTGVDWTNAYNSLNVAEAAEQDDYVTATEGIEYHLRASAGSKDTTAAIIDGSTTSEAYDIKIICNDWSYILQAANTNVLTLLDGWITATGIQVELTSINANYQSVISIDSMPSGQTTTLERVIMKSANNSTYRERALSCASGRTVNLINSVIWNVNAINTSVANSPFYNGGTVLNFYNCVLSGGYNNSYISSGTTKAINCIFHGANNTVGTGWTSSDYNASDKAVTTAGGNDIESATFGFVDSANGNFHITAGDSSGVKNGGVDDPSSGLYTTDIDGLARVSPWDIGVHEYDAITSTGGDIIAASIGSDGYTIDITFQEMLASGTHSLGMGLKNDPSTASITLTTTKEGYNASGTLGTKVINLYAVPCDDPDLGAMRLVDPNNAYPNEVASGSNLIVRYALSEYIYDDDVSITMDVLEGTYNDGLIDNNAATDFAVTNNSTLDYPKAIANWATSQARLAVGTSDIIEIVGSHKFAENGKPFACVKYEITDGATTLSGTLTDMTISADSQLGKILVYSIEEDYTTLDSGIITADFIAYPWVGDADSIVDTSDAVNTMPTPLYTSHTFRLDKTDVHGKTVVDPTSGNDGTGTVYATEALAEAGNAFQTHAAALTALAAYNNTNAGHNDAGGGIILCTEDTHIIGTSNGGTMDTFVKIKPISTALKANVHIQASGAGANMPGKMMIEGCTIDGGYYWNANNTKFGYVKDCVMAGSGTMTFYQFPYGVAHNCTGIFRYEFKPYSTAISNWAIIRGNDVDSFHDSKGWMVIGNNNVGLSQRGNTGIPLNENGIYAFNTTDDAVTSTMITLGYSEDTSHGFAIFQNKLIRYGSQTEPMMMISGDGTETNMNNIIIHNNTVIGARANIGYNDLASGGPWWQTNYSIKNNIFSNYNNKDDTFAHNVDGYGSWPVGYHVGSSGNHFRTSANDRWFGEFCGLWMTKGTGSVPLEPGFVEDNSADGADTSGGDYHLTALSPCLALTQDLLYPYDLDGRARIANDNPGAWTYKEVSGSNWFYNKMIGGA